MLGLHVQTLQQSGDARPVSRMDIRSKYSIQANTLVTGKFEKSWIAISELWYCGMSRTIWEAIDARDIIHVHVIVSHARVVYKNETKRINIGVASYSCITFTSYIAVCLIYLPAPKQLMGQDQVF